MWIALLLSLDLIVQLHVVFLRRSLYYFSILITTVGISFHALALGMQLFILHEPKFATTVAPKIACIMNVVGFGVVLYSRLNLVVRNQLILRLALAAIVLSGFLIYVPSLVILSLVAYSSGSRWTPQLTNMSRIEVLYFTFQELAFNSIYTYTSAKLLKDRYSKQRRNLFIGLLFAQAFDLVVDAAMVALVYRGLYTLKGALHPCIYAIKLKIEFMVLNQLSSVVQQNGNNLVLARVESSPLDGNSPSKKRDYLWPSKSGSKEQGPKQVNRCEHCQAWGPQAQKSASSHVARIEPSQHEINIAVPSPSHSAHASYDAGTKTRPTRTVTEGSVSVEDRGFDELGRQYLGKFP
jgi:hypothetical protein